MHIKRSKLMLNLWWCNLCRVIFVPCSSHALSMCLLRSLCPSDTWQMKGVHFSWPSLETSSNLLMSLEEGKKAKILFSVFSFFSHYIARLIFNQKENNGAREKSKIFLPLLLLLMLLLLLLMLLLLLLRLPLPLLLLSLLLLLLLIV